jgi:hypothetical protein
MMLGGQEFPPYASPPESALMPGSDYRKFTIPIKHIRACCTNPFHKLSDIGKIGLSIEGGRDGIQLD